MKNSRSMWVKNHTRRAHSIFRAFVKKGRRGYTAKGRWGFSKKAPTVW